MPNKAPALYISIKPLHKIATSWINPHQNKGTLIAMAENITIADILRRRHEAEIQRQEQARKYWLLLLPVTAVKLVLLRIAQVLLALFLLFLHPLIGWAKDVVQNSVFIQRYIAPFLSRHVGRYYHLYFLSLERLPPFWATLSIAVPLAVLEPAKMWATLLVAIKPAVGVPMWLGLQAVSFVLIEKTWEHVRGQARKIGAVRMVHNFLVLNLETVKRLIKASAFYRRLLGFRKRVQLAVSTLRRSARPHVPVIFGGSGRPWFDCCPYDEDYLDFLHHETSTRIERDAKLIWRLLDLKPGAQVIGLACRRGRVLQRLAVRGAHVAGLDRSDAYFGTAKDEARLRNIPVTYIHGDIAKLPPLPVKRRADAVLVPLAAFEDGADSAGLLHSCAHALKPGGAILIDQPNPEYLHQNGGPKEWALRSGADTLRGEVQYDAPGGWVMTRRTLARGGRTSETVTSVRLHTADTLANLLKQAGFSSIAAYGGDGKALTRNSPRQIVTARRQGHAPQPARKGRLRK
jgi:SAM-dependent methyltransferase